MANLRTSQSNQSCSLCAISEAVQLCPCKATPQLFCDSCVLKHFAESRSRCHPILPIDTLPYYKLPGYIEQYRERTGIKYEVALKTLRENLGEIDRWKCSVIDSTATIVKSLTDHSNNVVAALDALRVKLEDAITEGVRETEEAVFEPNPVLNNRIARGIRNCEEMNLVTCRTDFAEVTRQFEELIKTYVVLIQVEVPACIPIEQPQGEEMRAVVVHEKSLDRAANVSESYIGERNEENRKNGYGKMRLSDGSTIETHWKCDKPRGTGKYSSASHSFFVGDCNEYLNRNWRMSKKWIGFALLGVIVAMAVGSGSDCELRSRGPTETEMGAYTGQWNVRNEFHGFGMMRYSDSDMLVYEGQWVNGTKYGRGKETYRDGSEYEGDFVNGTRQGYGVYLSRVFNYTYLGTWKNNSKDGFGYESNKTETGKETVYIGEFAEGKLKGKGANFTSIYSVSVGYWKDSFIFGMRYENNSLCIGNVLQSKSLNCLSVPDIYFSLGASSNRYESKEFYKSKVDAITIRVSESIILTALRFAVYFDYNLRIMSLDIIEGTSTKGNILYSHSQELLMPSNNEDALVILQSKVLMEATHNYTIRVVLNGFCRSCLTSIQSISEDGIIEIFKPVFSDGDEDDNPSSNWFMFSALYYNSFYYKELHE